MPETPAAEAVEMLQRARADIAAVERVRAAMEATTGGSLVSVKVADLRAVLALLDGGGCPAWRPIETAPLDDTDILVWEDGEASVSAWSVEHGDWWGLGELASPTHWQPLPPPPATGGE